MLVDPGVLIVPTPGIEYSVCWNCQGSSPTVTLVRVAVIPLEPVAVDDERLIAIPSLLAGESLREARRVSKAMRQHTGVLSDNGSKIPP